MKKLIFLMFLVHSTFSLAQSIRVLPPLAPNSPAYSAWAREAQSRVKDNQSECREMTQIPGTILCLTGSMSAVSSYQGRASLFAEGAGQDMAGEVVGKGQLVERNSITYKAYSQQIGGTDIRSADLQRFYSQVERQCLCAPGCTDENECPTANYCLNESEQEMYDKVIAPAEAGGKPYVVIMAPHEYGIIVEHEVLHAQYFNDPAYKEAVDDFWANGMTAAERASVTRLIGTSYDKNDEYLVKNEFQAYAFKSEGSSFGPITQKYKTRLLAHLKSKGVEPILLSNL